MLWEHGTLAGEKKVWFRLWTWKPSEASWETGDKIRPKIKQSENTLITQRVAINLKFTSCFIYASIIKITQKRVALQSILTLSMALPPLRPQPQALPGVLGSTFQRTQDVSASVLETKCKVEWQGGVATFSARTASYFRSQRDFLSEALKWDSGCCTVREDFVLALQLFSKALCSFLILLTLCPVVFQISKVKSGTLIKTEFFRISRASLLIRCV